MKHWLRLMVVICLLLRAGLEGYGQTGCIERYERVYSTSQSDGANTGLFIQSGTITNASLAADEDNLTASTIVCSGALLGISRQNKWQHFTFSQAIPRSKSIHIKFSTEVAANLLGSTSITLHTYDNSTLLSSTPLPGGILGLASGSNMLDYVIPAPGGSGTYNAVRLELDVNAVLAASATVKIFEVYHNTSPDVNTGIACNGINDVIYGVDGASLLGGTNDIEAPFLIADGIDNTSAHLVANLSVANSVFITALFNSLSQPGDFVRVILRKGGGGLLDADVIASNFNVVAFKGNTSVGSLAAEAQFIELRLLPGSSEIQVLTFKIPDQFDRISVSLGNGLASALSDLYVYEIERVAPKPIIDAPGLEDNNIVLCGWSPLTFSVSNPEDCAAYHWFDANGNQITTGVTGNGVSFVPSTLPTGTHDFFVSAVRDGCDNEASDRAKVTVTIEEKPDPPSILLSPEN